MKRPLLNCRPLARPRPPATPFPTGAASPPSLPPARPVLTLRLLLLLLLPCSSPSPACPLQCLLERGGYTYLDVRPSPELDAVGKVKGSVNVPIMNGTFKYNPELRKKELIKEDNPDFVRMVGGCWVWVDGWVLDA